MTAATINGSRAVSVRLLTPWRGAWQADVDVDPELADAFLLTGPAVIMIDTVPPITLNGTIDPKGAGKFGSTVRVRVVGGGNGWDKPVQKQDYQQPGGVLSTLVYTATASQVGEVVVEIAPAVLAENVFVSSGPASRVLAGVQWHVDPLGITTVGPRLPAIADPSLEILTWSPLEQRAELAADALVVPGTVLTDPRFGTATIRDVEQTFDANGSRATAWCSDAAVSRLTEALKSAVVEWSGVRWARLYRYRFVVPGPGATVQLQAVDPTAGMPDALPMVVWTGMSGVTAKLAPSIEVLVEFIDGNPAQPIVRGFSTLALPLEVTVDASVAAHLAPTAPAVDVGAAAASVAIAGGAEPLVVGPWASALVVALTALASALTTGTLVSMASGGTALTTALGLLPPSATTKTKAT